MLNNCYSYTHVYAKNETKEYRKYVGNDFSEMAYNKNINGGYPFPKSLFSIGQYIENNVLNYLQDYGFDNI